MTYQSELEGMTHLMSPRRRAPGLAAGGREALLVCTLLSRVQELSDGALSACTAMNDTPLQSPAPDAPARQAALGAAWTSPPEPSRMTDKGSPMVW